MKSRWRAGYSSSIGHVLSNVIRSSPTAAAEWSKIGFSELFPSLPALSWQSPIPSAGSIRRFSLGALEANYRDGMSAVPARASQAHQNCGTGKRGHRDQVSSCRCSVSRSPSCRRFGVVVPTQSSTAIRRAARRPVGRGAIAPARGQRFRGRSAVIAQGNQISAA